MSTALVTHLHRAFDPHVYAQDQRCWSFYCRFTAMHHHHGGLWMWKEVGAFLTSPQMIID